MHTKCCAVAIVINKQPFAFETFCTCLDRESSLFLPYCLEGDALNVCFLSVIFLIIIMSFSKLKVKIFDVSIFMLKYEKSGTERDWRGGLQTEGTAY